MSEELALSTLISTLRLEKAVYSETFVTAYETSCTCRVPYDHSQHSENMRPHLSIQGHFICLQG
jgi:hypothetical protein